MTFDIATARDRCRRYRRRILDISQHVSALHIGSAYSCTEIIDCIYHGLLRPQDTFVLSKGHAGIMQYVVLEDLGIISQQDLDRFCTKDGFFGTHPDCGNPGIIASTGSLGHGLGMGVGMAFANRSYLSDGRIYVLLSDGELMEGSTWEAVLQASALRLKNLVVFIDNNDFLSLQRVSFSHHSFYPIDEKFRAFGWSVRDVHGHDASQLLNAANEPFNKPRCIVARTVKGKGVSFMENVPVWHYRSPNQEEYTAALAELAA